MGFLIVRGLDAVSGPEVWKIKRLTRSSRAEYFTTQREWLDATSNKDVGMRDTNQNGEQ